MASNPGVAFAREAAEAADALVAIPSFEGPTKGSDYNDLWLAEGEDAVRRWLDPDVADKAKTTLSAAPPFDEDAEDEGDGGEQEHPGQAVTRDDFYAYMPMHNYMFVPSRELWPAASVNARIPPVREPATDKPIKANVWLDRHQAVEQMTWAPGEPEIIDGRLVSHGGWIDRPGCRTFNLYLPPVIELGDASSAGLWLDHVHRVYPSEADHIIAWLAHRVQRPGEKINHALVLGGVQGVGKDSILEPTKYAVGPWNFIEVSPAQLLGRFNGFAKAVVLRISEARDLGDVDRFGFYDHTKIYTAAPPDVLRVDEKNLREHSVPNVCGVIITTNYKADGIFLPADDRRHYVAWSDCAREDFKDAYWTELWRWYHDGGIGHVAAYLAELDLSAFNPKAPPAKTPAFWAIVDASRAPEVSEVSDALDELGNPNATTLKSLANAADPDFRDWITDRRNRRAMPHRMESAGYVPVRNDAAKDGLWKIGQKRQVVYARKELTLREQIAEATTIARLGQ